MSTAKKSSKINSLQVGGTHYISKAIQPWDAMESWMDATEFQGYLRGNVIKYVARCNEKGSPMQDLQKAQHYLQKLLEVMEKRAQLHAKLSGVRQSPDDVKEVLTV